MKSIRAILKTKAMLWDGRFSGLVEMYIKEQFLVDNGCPLISFCLLGILWGVSAPRREGLMVSRDWVAAGWGGETKLCCRDVTPSAEVTLHSMLWTWHYQDNTGVADRRMAAIKWYCRGLRGDIEAWGKAFSSIHHSVSIKYQVLLTLLCLL